MADLRRCIGSERFGIVAHEAPVTDFPAQPSQKDGLGRMCKTHWRAYTTALRKAARARTAADVGAVTEIAPTDSEAPSSAAHTRAGGRRARGTGAPKPEPSRTRPARGRKTEGEPIVEARDAAVGGEVANVEEASTA